MSSVDILYYSLAACAVVLTIFSCIFLFQGIKFFRHINKSIEAVKDKFNRFYEVLNAGIGVFGVMNDLIKLGIGFLMDKYKNKKKTK